MLHHGPADTQPLRVPLSTFTKQTTQYFRDIGQTTGTTSLPLFNQSTQSGEPRMGTQTTNPNTHQQLKNFAILSIVEGPITQPCTTNL